MKLRRLIKEITVTEKGKRWTDRKFHAGTQETVQLWDDKKGWTDLPAEYEYIFVDKKD